MYGKGYLMKKTASLVLMRINNKPFRLKIDILFTV